MSPNETKAVTLTAARNDFARKLQAALSALGWSQNDLVERSKTIAESDKAALQAYDVSNYIRGRSLPRPEKLETIAKILRMTAEELLPNRGVSPARSPSPMEMRQGEDGNVWLRLERTVSYTTALAIMKLLADEDGENSRGWSGYSDKWSELTDAEVERKVADNVRARVPGSGKRSIEEVDNTSAGRALHWTRSGKKRDVDLD